jgi:hypothetical protein
MLDPTVIGTAITAAASIATTAMVVRDRGKVAETHHQVTQNHHSSESPTVLDAISDLRGDVADVIKEQRAHIRWHLDH